jgi:hypothetical protein
MQPHTPSQNAVAEAMGVSLATTEKMKEDG